MRLFVILLALAAVAFGLAWSLGCCSSPDATSLPEDEGAIQVVGGETPAVPVTPAAPAAPEAPTAPAAPAAPRTTPVPAGVKYSALLLKSVKGGRIAYAVPGTVDQVLAMLADFENAAGNRAWAQTYKTLERSPDRVLAEWKFRGKFGMNPTVHLEFVTTRAGEGAQVKFELKKKSIGIASFFGDFQVTPLAGTPPRVQIVERTFIDSGIAFANASAEDIEKGLREDARLIRAWMTARSAKKN